MFLNPREILSVTNPRSPGLKNWLMLLCLAVIWGSSFMGAKLALTGFGPMTLAAGRICIGAVVLTGLTYATGRSLPAFATRTDKRIWLHCLGLALFTNAIPFTLLNWGQLRVTSGFAGICMAVVPLLILPLAHFLLAGERMSARKFIGFVIGFVGVIVLIGPAAFGRSGDSLENLARLACIGAACCYAIGSIITRLSPPTSVRGFSAAALVLASIIMLPLASFIEGWPQAPNGTAVIGLIYLGLMPTALATVMLVTIINSAGPTFLSLVNYQVPVWAVVFGVLLLDESLPSQFLGALALILAGLAISQSRRKRQ
ncbi:MAG: DMT family transporter, partial [Rhodobacteraceae bacterium]|nr:DMT family transporter [Paracoccaceae bacterium]